MNNKTLSNHIVNYVSDFAKDKKTNWGIWKYDNISETWFCVKKLKYWKICIDEKDVQWQVYTIISDATNGMMMWMYPWLKANEVINFFKTKLWEEWRSSIKEVSADMSSTIEAIIRWLFPNAEIVTDRFHVMKKLLEDVWATRSRAKTLIRKRISDARKDYNNKMRLKIQKKKNKKLKNTKRWRPKENYYKTPKNINWETDIEIVERIHWQTKQRKTNWNQNQKDRRKVAKQILELSETIEIYEYLYKLWLIYDNETITRLEWIKAIRTWILEGKELRSRIIEVDNMIWTIERRFETICNYFISRHSNWYAEGLNSRIQRLLSISRWFINKDYMIYRIIKLFVPQFHLF